jgi:hypothetical protein
MNPKNRANYVVCHPPHRHKYFYVFVAEEANSDVAPKKVDVRTEG